MSCPCPCCRYLTIDGKPPGTFEICPVCGWEDDNIQYANPEYAGGANKESLNQARQNFIKFGAKSVDAKRLVREPLPNEKPSQ